jgi:photosystem II stability/assembly factor-like uncharacterized protein
LTAAILSDKTLPTLPNNDGSSLMTRFAFSLALALTFITAAFAQRPGNFTVVGPGGGGAMFRPVVSPHDPNTVLVACDMTGAYITHDGGKSWRMFNLRGVAEFFVFDPHDKNVIYVQSTALWRSQDNGETWKLVYPKAAAVKGVKMNSDHSDEDVLADPNPLGAISAMAIDPTNSKILYATAGDRKAGPFGLYISRNAGESWSKLIDLPATAFKVFVNQASSEDQRSVVVAGPKFIRIWKSSGGRDIPVSPGQKITDISVGFTPQGNPVFYAIAEERTAFVSDDLGTHWRKIQFGNGDIKQNAIATSLLHPEIAYVSYRDLEDDGLKYMGVAKTTDTGRTWSLAWKEDINPVGKPGANIHDAWITEKFGSDWAGNPLTISVANQDANLVYATDLGRTMKSSDGGATWNAVYSQKSTGGGWTSTGLDVTTSYGYHFDPFDKNRQFISTTDIGLFRSEDGGASWMQSTDGVPRDWRNTTYWIVFDPAVKGRVWSVNSWTHDLPRPKMWRRSGVAKYRGGVCISNDGGKTWVKSNDGMDQTAATFILLDPTSPVDSRTLYVTGFGRGVYKSTNGGKSWTLKNNGIAQKEPFAWRISRDDKGTLYLLISRRSEDGSIGTDKDGAMYRSTDGAEHWTPVAMPEGANAPNGLAIDPKDSNRLYLATWARATGEHGDGGGIYLSEDAGKTWKQVLDRDRHIYDITIDPRDAKILYAAGFESSAWISHDAGEHWSRIPGFNFKWGHRVTPDPENPKAIYITTFGGGVWHGTVDGKDRPLDIATPELQPAK